MTDRPRVLIVGKSRDICEKYRPVAVEGGFSVHMAEDGNSAFAMAAKEVFDLVVIDLSTGDDGFPGLLEQVRQSDPETVVILISDIAGPQRPSDRTVINEAFECLRAPFNAEELSAAITRGLARRRSAVRARQLTALFDSMAEGIFVVNREANVLFSNPAGLRMLGINGPVQEGMRMEQALGQQPGLAGAIRRALSQDLSGFVGITEEIDTGVSGAPLLMAAITPFRDYRGEDGGIICTLRGVAARTGTEHVKSQFVSMVTHELRAPLAAVEGYLTAYLTGAVGSDPKINRQMLERARLRTHSLLDLVSDLLQYSRLDSRRVERRRELINLADVIVGTMELMKTQDESKELKFRTHMDATLPLIEANRLEMEQLFTNLISNAIKYNVKKGIVEISAEVKEGMVEVRVSDTGIGIDREDIPCIFDEFFRVSGPKTRYTTGTGLGLSIVKKIVDAHFGTIKVESEVDKGTTFVVRLPLGAGRHEEMDRGSLAGSESETARICG